MRLAFVASDTSVAQQARRKLVERYGDVPAVEAELIVALGGDGFMLRTLHAHLALGVPVYGMKLGRVGFLMNKHRVDGLPERVARAHAAELFPLEMLATDAAGGTHRALAFNVLRRILPRALVTATLSARIVAEVLTQIALNVQRFVPERQRPRTPRDKPHKFHAYKPAV